MSWNMQGRTVVVTGAVLRLRLADALVRTVEDAVACYREMLASDGETAEALRARLPELRGKNLACWCREGSPCHVDTLLTLAND